MSFLVRAMISLLSGIGAGVVGFWSVWLTLIGPNLFYSVPPGKGYDKWLLAGIFLPLIAVPFLVFRQITWATQRTITRSADRE
ncbi:MAG: hypothetical protein ACKO23_08550 [Gemmataceae bacterium]